MLAPPISSSKANVATLNYKQREVLGEAWPTVSLPLSPEREAHQQQYSSLPWPPGSLPAAECHQCPFPAGPGHPLPLLLPPQTAQLLQTSKWHSTLPCQMECWTYIVHITVNSKKKNIPPSCQNLLLISQVPRPPSCQNPLLKSPVPRPPADLAGSVESTVRPVVSILWMTRWSRTIFFLALSTISSSTLLLVTRR